MTQCGGGIGDYSGQGPIKKVLRGERGPELTDVPRGQRYAKFRDEILKDPEIKAAYDEAKERNKNAGDS